MHLVAWMVGPSILVMIHGSPRAKLLLDQHERLLESVFLDLSHKLIPFGLGPWSSDLKGVWATPSGPLVLPFRPFVPRMTLFQI